MGTGATDMSNIRAKGPQCYGIGPALDSEDGQKGFSAHSDQERILIEELHRFVRFQFDVVMELARAFYRAKVQILDVAPQQLHLHNNVPPPVLSSSLRKKGGKEITQAKYSPSIYNVLTTAYSLSFCFMSRE